MGRRIVTTCDVCLRDMNENEEHIKAKWNYMSTPYDGSGVKFFNRSILICSKCVMALRAKIQYNDQFTALSEYIHSLRVQPTNDYCGYIADGIEYAINVMRNVVPCPPKEVER